MEYGEIESFVQTEEIIIPDRLETGFDIEIKDEFWTVMGNDRSDEQTTVNNITAIPPEIDPVQRYEDHPQFYAVRLPLRCRLCAIPDNDMVDIFEPNGTDDSIVEKIQRCLPVVVKETDPLPKQACQLCLANLELCYQFHKTVEEAERQLIVFNSLPQPEISCLPPPPCDDNIEGRKQSPTAETSIEEQITVSQEAQTDTTVKSSIQLADLKPCAVLLNNDKTLGKNNLGTKSARGSLRGVQTFDSERILAPVTDQQNICDSEVPGDTPNKIFSLQTGMEGAHQAESGIHKPNAGGPPYKCDYCSKTFTTKSHRTCHTKIHVGYGPYYCSYCNKEFSLMSHRDRHHSTHTGERPFKCSTCEKTFSSLSCLKRHTIIHLAPREYLCSLCNRSFKTLAMSKSHGTNHMVARPFQCDYCENHFMKKCGLRSHVTSCRQRYKLKSHADVVKFQVSDPKELQQHVFSNF